VQISKPEIEGDVIRSLTMDGPTIPRASYGSILRRVGKAHFPHALAVAAAVVLGIVAPPANAQNAAQRAALVRASRARSQAVPQSGAEATAITLDSPNGLVFDSNGNLYIADTEDQVVLEVSVAGPVSTIAGNGVQGFAGDGGAATSAQLDTPTGVAVDSNGNIYIADSHNHRIREVSGGIITTIAGTGAPGFSGDGGAATSAKLDMPFAVCVDSSGNIYIADTNNNRIREISAGTINTVAGNGLQMFLGDGGAAKSAALDSPIGVAVDGAFNIYIGDTHNQRVRMVTASSNIINTIAGTGIKGFTTDGPALAAALASPSGVWVDSSGKVYVADTDNNLIRTINGGNVATIAGNGVQGYSGDAGPATQAALNTPRAVTVAGSTTFFSDTLNNRVREVTGATINTIGGQPPPSTESLVIGGVSSTVYGTGTLTARFSNGGQTGTGLVTFYDGEGPNPAMIGSASLTANVASINSSALAAGTHYLFASYAGDAKDAPIVSGIFVFVVTPAPLTATANSRSLLYGQAIPTLSGTLSGVLPQDFGNVTAVFSATATVTSAPGAYPISVALNGSAAGNYTVTLGTGSGSITIAQAPTVTTLTASSTTPVLGASATLIATVSSTTSGTPTGTVNFFNGSVQLNAAPVALNGGVATLSVTTLPVGAISLTAVYSASTDFIASTSSVLAGMVLSPDFSISATPAVQSVLPTQSENYAITVTPTNSTFVYPVSLTVSGLPAGVSATLNPSSIASGAGASTITMTVSATSLAKIPADHDPWPRSGAATALALLLFPLAFTRRLRRTSKKLMRSSRVLLSLLALAALGAISGCGAGGFFSHGAGSHTVTVTATSGPGTHTTSVTLIVQ
jgi:sugar lactone lactonase YvrE